jgi:hypothetical protein
MHYTMCYELVFIIMPGYIFSGLVLLVITKSICSDVISFKFIEMI